LSEYPGKDGAKDDRAGGYCLGCFLLFIAALLMVFSLSWMIAEHPDKTGRIVSSNESRFSPVMILLSMACVALAAHLFTRHKGKR